MRLIGISYSSRTKSIEPYFDIVELEMSEREDDLYWRVIAFIISSPSGGGYHFGEELEEAGNRYAKAVGLRFDSRQYAGRSVTLTGTEMLELWGE